MFLITFCLVMAQALYTNCNMYIQHMQPMAKMMCEDQFVGNLLRGHIVVLPSLMTLGTSENSGTDQNSCNVGHCLYSIWPAAYRGVMHANHIHMPGT